MAITQGDEQTNATMADQGGLNAGQAGGGASTASTQPLQQQTQPQQQQPVQPSQQQQPAQTQPPHTGKANIFRSIMEVLAGPQTKRKVLNPNTGALEDDPNQPQRTRGQLANSIVAGALTGLFSGAGERGPGAGMRGAAAGFQARQQQLQQAQQQANQEPVDAYNRKINIATGNFKLHQLALQTADQDYEFNKKINQSNTNTYNELNDAGELLDDKIKEEEISDAMKKYHVGRESFIRTPDDPYPVIGPDGKQSTNPDGTLKFGNTYAVVNPNAKVSVTDKI